MSKHSCPWLLNVAALCKRALGTLRRGWPLRIHILPPHLHAFSGLFFKSFQCFFLWLRLNSPWLKKGLLHGNNCWKTNHWTKLTFTTKSSDAWIITNTAQDTMGQNLSALSLPWTKLPGMLHRSSLPCFSPLFAIPWSAVDRDSQQGLENFPVAEGIVFTFPKDSPTLKQLKNQGLLENSLLSQIFWAKDLEVRVCLFQMVPLTLHSR